MSDFLVGLITVLVYVAVGRRWSSWGKPTGGPPWLVRYLPKIRVESTDQPVALAEEPTPTHVS
jgi:hypothetical protein